MRRSCDRAVFLDLRKSHGNITETADAWLEAIDFDLSEVFFARVGPANSHQVSKPWCRILADLCFAGGADSVRGIMIESID